MPFAFALIGALTPLAGSAFVPLSYAIGLITFSLLGLLMVRYGLVSVMVMFSSYMGPAKCPQKGSKEKTTGCRYRRQRPSSEQAAMRPRWTGLTDTIDRV